MNELRLSEIWIYPIKSLGGIRVEQAKVLQKGLEYDRRWMLVDENGMFMTQRTSPALALFKLNIEDNALRITHSQLPIIHNTPLQPTSSEPESNVIIWNDTVRGIEVDPATSAWFSDTLGMKCKLIYFPEKNQRPVDPNYSIQHEQVSLADAYPFLIIGQGTLDHLNTKLDVKLPMNRFRPNFVFTGGTPHVEDSWRNFTIGKNRFVGVKPCARCILPNVNQETAEKGDEPLRTLATYRKQENKILFGQNLLAVDHLEVRQGDVIMVNPPA